MRGTWLSLAGLIFLFTAALTSPAATLHVTDSITKTLAQAHDGDTVIVQGPAVFHEHVTISISIQLVGTNSPVIDGDGADTPLTIAAPHVAIRGVTIRNSGRDLAAFDCGILVNAPGATVAHCRIESDAFGIYLRGAGNCVAEQNDILGNPDIPSAKRGNGIHLWKTSGNRIVNNVVHDKRDGIYLTYTDNTVIAGNRVKDTRFGIHYMYSHQNELITNSLTRNAVGAALMFSRQLLVQGNVMTANRRHGMVLKQIDGSRILDNVVAGQNRGFFVQQANQNRFERNVIATNDVGLYLSSGSEENTFVGNAFIWNTDQVWQPPFEAGEGQHGPNSFSEKGRGNYWSDYTGSDRNGDGIGDTPYHETDVFGYIVDRNPKARVLAFSPALAVLREGEEMMPLLDTTGVTDLTPLMKPIVVGENGVMECWSNGLGQTTGRGFGFAGGFAAFDDSSRLEVFGNIMRWVSPHPDPLPREREQWAVAGRNSRAPMALAAFWMVCSQQLGRLRTGSHRCINAWSGLPLPKGEGWGEGKRTALNSQTEQNEASQPKLKVRLALSHSFVSILRPCRS